MQREEPSGVSKLKLNQNGHGSSTHKALPQSLWQVWPQEEHPCASSTMQTCENFAQRADARSGARRHTAASRDGAADGGGSGGSCVASCVWTGDCAATAASPTAIAAPSPMADNVSSVSLAPWEEVDVSWLRAEGNELLICCVLILDTENVDGRLVLVRSRFLGGPPQAHERTRVAWL